MGLGTRAGQKGPVSYAAPRAEGAVWESVVKGRKKVEV